MSGFAAWATSVGLLVLCWPLLLFSRREREDWGSLVAKELADARAWLGC